MLITVSVLQKLLQKCDMRCAGQAFDLSPYVTSYGVLRMIAV